MHADQFRLNKRCHYPLPAEAPRLLALPDGADLNIINLQHTLEVQVSSVVGDHIQLEDATALYFRTIHTWFPIVSEAAYRTKLSRLRVQTAAAPSDLSLLILCVALVCKEPVDGELPPLARSQYASLKSFVALLEAMGLNTLQMLQSRALLTIFEVGHAMYPAACISATANTCAATALGINATDEKLHTLYQNSKTAEEARQTWRGIVITERLEMFSANENLISYNNSSDDRYTSLESAQPPRIPQGQSTVAVSSNEVSN